MQQTVVRLMNLLVEQKYAEIAKWSKNIRLTEDEIKEAVDRYGQKLLLPPKDFLNTVNFIETVEENDGRKRWYVVFDLWMEMDGKSDLSVEATFIDSTKEHYDIEVDNIHVM